MTEDLHKLHQELPKLPSATTDLFKRRLTCLMDKHIPSKVLNLGQTLRKPWVDKKVYTRMKRSKKGKDLMKNKALQSKKDGKDQETIQSSTTPDPGYHMGK